MNTNTLSITHKAGSITGRLRSHTLAVVAGSCALFLTACGGRDDDSVATTDPYDTTATEEEVVSTTPSATGTSGTTGATGTTGGTTGSTTTAGTTPSESYQAGQDVASQATGLQLEQRIRSELRTADDLGLEDQEIEQIDIQVEQNAVTLAGTVPNEEAVESVEERVRRVQGVQQIHNELRVSE